MDCQSQLYHTSGIQILFVCCCFFSHNLWWHMLDKLSNCKQNKTSVSSAFSSFFSSCFSFFIYHFSRLKLNPFAFMRTISTTNFRHFWLSRNRFEICQSFSLLSGPYLFLQWEGSMAFLPIHNFFRLPLCIFPQLK